MLHYDSIKSQNAKNIEKEQSEKELTINEFVESYNKQLPKTFTKTTVPLLKEFKETHQKLFKQHDAWTLSRHRKGVMDWLAQRVDINKETD